MTEIYADDGYTGTNSFDGPRFQRLLEDIRKAHRPGGSPRTRPWLGGIRSERSTTISAFSRPMEVRLWRWSEGSDTAAGHNSIALPFWAAANDFYTADISMIRAAWTHRRRSGPFIGASSSWGTGRTRNSGESPGGWGATLDRGGGFSPLSEERLGPGTALGV